MRHVRRSEVEDLEAMRKRGEERRKGRKEKGKGIELNTQLTTFPLLRSGYLVSRKQSGLARCGPLNITFTSSSLVSGLTSVSILRFTRRISSVFAE